MKAPQALLNTPFVRAATKRAIVRWLNDRQELLLSFHQLCNLRPFVTTEPSLSQTTEEFCQRLVDYLCTGHFALFEPIARATELFRSHVAKTRSILLALEQSTASILNFNDKYQELQKINHLEKDLSWLGEKIAERFEEEDRLIAIYEAIYQAETTFAKSA